MKRESMAKRLLLNVSDSLHQSLKLRAAREGVSLSALCASLLEENNEREPKQDDDLLEPMLYATLPLNVLRDELQRVATRKMNNHDKRQRLLKINNEMASRYRL